MKNKKFLSVLLCLALLASLPVLPGGAAAADDAPDNGMKISKTATANEDGSYTITLEAYATGSQVTTTVQKDIPTDIVLVVDQSGSMDDPIGGYTYTEYRVENYYNSRNYYNNEYYPLRHNGGSENLWHKLDDDKYVAVSVVQESDHQAISGWSNSNYYYNRSNLYCLIDGEYKNVTVEYQWNAFSADEYTYKVSGQQILHTTGRNSTPDFGKYAPLYQSVKKYTYSYTLNGNTTVIEESFEDGSSPNTQFYKKDYNSDAGGTRLNALKNAANAFANAVAAKAAGADGDINTTADNVNHRIAVVGYADTDWDYGYNTGVFIGSTLKRYETAVAGVYGTALQDMSTTGGKNNVTASLNALQASGATRTDYGLTMAKGILDANPVPAGETRNRVVIVFTDGSPTDSNGFELSVANAAISNANAIKDSGATVYSIGIFSGADASSAGTQPSGDLNDNSSRLTAACNWFMQQISSNNGTPHTPSYYLSAGDAASLNNIFQQISDQIQTGGSSTTLNSSTVIKDIISPSFVLKEGNVSDIALETYACTGKNSNGEYTWSKNADAMGATATITEADIAEEPKKLDQVNVTGFNFSENWCGTETVNGKVTYRGNKLVIKIKVEPRPGFLGGNDVYTNTSAGVYENASATEPVLPFDRPQTDVTIKEPAITLPDANVYLGAYFNETVNAEDLKKGTSITFGSGDSAVSLDLTQPNNNWGLEAWQTEYVTIEVKVTDKAGNEVTEFDKLTDDTQYKVSVSINPKTPKEGNNGYDEAMTGTIHVFKPELTFKDSSVEYKKTTVANSDYYADNNKVGDAVWKNGGKTSTDTGVKMLGTKPELALTYTTADRMFDNNGLVISTEDIPVQVTVKIDNDDVTNYTTFVHQKCNLVDNCQWTAPTEKGNPAFLLHVIKVVGDLTITKTGLNQHTYTGEKEDQESAIFKVEGDNQTWYVAINANANGTGSVTLTGLKVGKYTVRELTDWTWRYDSSTLTSDSATANANGSITVTVTGGDGAVTTVRCENGSHNDKWLGGDNYKNNVFGN